MKNKWDLEGILDQKHYRSIINLTSQYQNKEDGLRQLHYRWALIENHDNINQTSFKRDMINFFRNPTLTTYEKQGYIKIGCITGNYPNNNLTNFLNKLSDPNEYGILVKHKDKDNITRYKIPESFEAKIKLYEIAKTIESIEPEKLTYILEFYDYTKFKRKGIKTNTKNNDKRKVDIGKESMSFITPFILDLDEKILKKCSKKEKEELNKHIHNILEACIFVNNIKYEKIGESTGIFLYVESYAEALEEWLEYLEKEGFGKITKKSKDSITFHVPTEE